MSECDSIEQGKKKGEIYLSLFLFLLCVLYTYASLLSPTCSVSSLLILLHDYKTRIITKKKLLLLLSLFVVRVALGCCCCCCYYIVSVVVVKPIGLRIGCLSSLSSSSASFFFPITIQFLKAIVI